MWVTNSQRSELITRERKRDGTTRNITIWVSVILLSLVEAATISFSLISTFGFPRSAIMSQHRQRLHRHNERFNFSSTTKLNAVILSRLLRVKKISTKILSPTLIRWSCNGLIEHSNSKVFMLRFFLLSKVPNCTVSDTIGTIVCTTHLTLYSSICWQKIIRNRYFCSSFKAYEVFAKPFVTES